MKRYPRVWFGYLYDAWSNKQLWTKTIRHALSFCIFIFQECAKAAGQACGGPWEVNRPCQYLVYQFHFLLVFRFLDSALAPSYVSSLPEQSNVDLLKYVMQDGGSQLPYIYHKREWADEMADGICCCPEKRVGGVHYKYV